MRRIHWRRCSSELRDEVRRMDRLEDSQKSLVPEPFLSGDAVVPVAKRESRNTTPTPKNTCPSETTSATGKSIQGNYLFIRLVYISKTGICAGKGPECWPQHCFSVLSEPWLHTEELGLTHLGIYDLFNLVESVILSSHSHLTMPSQAWLL